MGMVEEPDCAAKAIAMLDTGLAIPVAAMVTEVVRNGLRRHGVADG
jgi:hypothetical protein